MLCHVSPSLQCFVVFSISIPTHENSELFSFIQPWSVRALNELDSPIRDPFSFSRQDYFFVQVVRRSWLSVQNRHGRRQCDDYVFRLDQRCHRCCAAMSSTFESFSVDNAMPNRMALMFALRNHDVFPLAIDLDTNLHKRNETKRKRNHLIIAWTDTSVPIKTNWNQNISQNNYKRDISCSWHCVCAFIFI